jgi:hypothetical protein
VTKSIRLRDRLVDVQALNLSLLLALSKLKIRADLVVDHRHYRFQNLVVAGATAEVAGHPFFDLILGGFGVLVEERLGGHDLSRRADPALEPAVLNESLLQWMEPTILCEPFDGFDILALASDGKCQTRTYDTAVDDHAASATNADTATFLGAGEADVIPQGLEKQPVGFQLEVMLFTVNKKPNLFFHEFGAYLLRL